MTPYQVIKTVSVTEKSNDLLTQNKYTFVVDPSARKDDIRRAVETVFSRKVEKVNVMHRMGKKRRNKYGVGRCADWKKAIVTLQAGEEPIELF
jgi:large subunit ribosomal protein L23